MIIVVQSYYTDFSFLDEMSSESGIRLVRVPLRR